MPETEVKRQVGVVAIGRNEGERLEACLRSIVDKVACVVYVDSGSTDHSLTIAGNLGVEIVELDTTIPFTAARARNAGIAKLIAIEPQIVYLQVIDGDCVVVDGWLETAAAELDHDDKLAVVCGRRRERYPDASIYNQLIDMEWNTPIGPAAACGGDSMIRRSTFEEVGGFNDALICGEEPEMCLRMRDAGYKIERLDHEMTLHDAAMTRLSEWWRRSLRGGWAREEGAAMYGQTHHYNTREAYSNWLWGLIVPMIVIVAAWPTFGLSLLLLAAYPVLMWRVYRYRRSRGDAARAARLYAGFCVLGKLPNALGQLKYRWTKLRGKRATLIEYKSSQVQHEARSES